MALTSDSARTMRHITFLAAVLAVTATSFLLPAATVAAGEGGKGFLESRISKLEDEKQIHDLMLEYGHLLDTRDLEGYARLFAKNGTWSGRIGGKFITVTGYGEILAMMKGAFGNQAYDPDHVDSYHQMTNIRIHVDGDTATATSKWTYIVRGKNNEPVVRMGGHYIDEFIREDGQWKFLHRAAPRDIP